MSVWRQRRGQRRCAPERLVPQTWDGQGEVQGTRSLSLKGVMGFGGDSARASVQTLGIVVHLPKELFKTATTLSQKRDRPENQTELDE